MKPEQFFWLQKQGALLDTQFNPGGNGSRASGAIYKGYGFQIEWTNHLPSGVVTDVQKNNYSVDGTGVVALAMQRDAIGTVLRQGVQTETEYDVSRQGTLVVSKVVAGHGVLRPECLAAIVDE